MPTKELKYVKVPNSMFIRAKNGKLKCVITDLKKHMVSSIRYTINEKKTRRLSTHKFSNSMLYKKISHKGIHVV